MTSLVNLTPHQVVICRDDGATKTIEPDGRVARLPIAREFTGTLSIDGFEVPTGWSHADDLVEGLPNAEAGVVFIVSRMVAERCRHRSDLLFPDDLIRDEFGRLVGCRRLATVAAVALRRQSSKPSGDASTSRLRPTGKFSLAVIEERERERLKDETDDRLIELVCTSEGGESELAETVLYDRYKPKITGASKRLCKALGHRGGQVSGCPGPSCTFAFASATNELASRFLGRPVWFADSSSRPPGRRRARKSIAQRWFESNKRDFIEAGAFITTDLNGAGRMTDVLRRWNHDRGLQQRFRFRRPVPTTADLEERFRRFLLESERLVDVFGEICGFEILKRATNTVDLFVWLSRMYDDACQTLPPRATIDVDRVLRSLAPKLASDKERWQSLHKQPFKVGNTQEGKSRGELVVEIVDVWFQSQYHELWSEYFEAARDRNQHDVSSDASGAVTKRPGTRRARTETDEIDAADRSDRSDEITGDDRR